MSALILTCNKHTTHIPPVVSPPLEAEVGAAFLVVVGGGGGVYLDEDVVGAGAGVGCTSAFTGLEVVACAELLEVELEDEEEEDALALQRLLLEARFLMGAATTGDMGAATGARAPMSWRLLRAMWPPWLNATAERAREKIAMHLLMEGIIAYLLVGDLLTGVG